MPRKRGLVHLSAGDIALVADHLVDILPAAVIEVPEAPRTIRQILEPLGATRREQLTRAAIAVSGSSDRSSKAYRSTRRRLERYVTESGERRAPKLPGLAEIARTIRRPTIPTGMTLHLSMTADVIYKGQTKNMPAGGPQVLEAEDLGKVRRLLREGDEQGAARALLDEWVYAYRLNSERDADGVIGNIERVSIEVQR